jgi:hypothetical protein
MLKFVDVFLIAIFFTGCGIDTSSSPLDNSTVTEANMTNLIDLNLTDLNQVIVDLNSTTDENSSTGTVDDGGTVVVVNPDSSNYDTVGAIEDPNSCNSATYRIVSDASYGGSLSGENGASGFTSEGQGLVIRSEYLSQDYASTWVHLYHKSFPTPENLGLQGSASYRMDGVFQLSYDLAWADKSISGIDNVVYVQSDKDKKPACYRLTLDSIIGSEIKVQKVFRKKL